MKRLFMLVLLLPTLGACTMDNDYYANEYGYPAAGASVTQYQTGPRTRAYVQPAPERVIIRRPGRQVYRHNRDETVVVRQGRNNTQAQVIQRR